MTKSKWPRSMPFLSASDFGHGGWTSVVSGKLPDSKDGFYVDVSDLSPKELEKAECEIQCCLVGHVRHAFSLPSDPASGEALPIAGQEFLIQFCEEADRPIDFISPDSGSKSVEYAASRVFESGDNDYSWLSIDDVYGNGNGADEMTPKDAARYWRKTLKHFGYTEIK